MKYFFILSLISIGFLNVQSQNPTTANLEETDSLINVYLENEDYTAAIPYAETLLASCKEDNQSKINALYHLYSIYNNLYDNKKSEIYLKKIIPISLKIHGEKSTKYATYLGDLAASYNYQGKFKSSEELFKQVIAIIEQDKNNPTKQELLTAKLHLADLYQRIGKYREAEEIYLAERDHKAKVLGKKSEEYAKALANLAIVYFYTEQYTTSETLFKEYVDIFKTIFGNEHPRYAAALDNLATFYLGRERLQEAEPLFLKAADIQLKNFGKESGEYLFCLEHLGQLNMSLKKYSDAEKILVENINIGKKVWGENHEYYGIAISNLAKLYYSMNQYEKAIPLYQKSLSIIEKTIGKSTHEYISYKNNLASSYLQSSQLEKVETTLLESIHANIEDNSFTFPINAVSSKLILNSRLNSFEQLIATLNFYYQSQYKLYEKDGNQDHLEQVYLSSKLAIELSDKTRMELNADTDELYRLGKSNHLVEKTLALYFKWEKKHDNMLNEIFQMAELHRSALLHKAVKTQDAYSYGSLPDSLVEKEQTLHQQLSEAQANMHLENGTSQEVKQVVLNTVLSEISKLKKYLKEKFPKYSALKYEPNHITLEQIQKQIPDRTMLLEYVLSDSIIYVFSVTKQNAILHQLPIARAELTKQVQSLRKALSNYDFIQKEKDAAYKLYSRTAYWFYTALLAPILKDSSQIENLIIIADGELGHVPFEAFLTKYSQTEKDYRELPYLLNQYQISYNYSATLWQENTKETNQKNNNLLLAFAGNYKPETTKNNLRPSHLQNLRNSLIELPAAQAEVEELSKLFDGDFLQGKDANEKKFKEKASEYKIIHLAMHGILNTQHPVLSSLAFSENGDSTEDNFLLAYEISHLQLQAELVVLSACETGYGKFQQGEGIMSLARSFMYAGVPSLIVSLWQVNDYATSEIMKNIYNNLSQGMNKDKALQTAKLEYIQRTQGIAAHPAFWSAFILIGNTHPVVLKTTSSGLWWGIGGFIILSGIIFFIIRSKKKNKNK